MRKEVEVMRVVRIPPMGKLVVDAGPQRLETLDDSSNDQVRHRLLAAIGELVSFAGGYEVLVDAGVAPLLPGSSSATTVPGQETLNAEQAAFLDELERELKATSNSVAPAPSPRLEELEQAPPHASAPSGDGTAVNLVSEIDTILQRHVQANPGLNGRSIHLEQPAGRALQIRVDGHTYRHPNDIEDDEVRQVLKQALKEWEKR
jgi:hypothetical protein